VLGYVTYSPNFVPCDVLIFKKQKVSLEVPHFEFLEYIQTKVLTAEGTVGNHLQLCVLKAAEMRA
jgi:hypothetical protein